MAEVVASRSAGEGRRVLRGISFRRGDFWIAVCLDHYLVTFARDEEDLDHKIHEMIMVHVEASLELQCEPFSDLPPAPEEYWELWRHAPQETRKAPPAELFGLAFPELLLKRAAPEAVARC